MATTQPVLIAETKEPDSEKLNRLTSVADEAYSFFIYINRKGDRFLRGIEFNLDRCHQENLDVKIRLDHVQVALRQINQRFYELAEHDEILALDPEDLTEAYLHLFQPSSVA